MISLATKNGVLQEKGRRKPDEVRTEKDLLRNDQAGHARVAFPEDGDLHRLESDKQHDHRQIRNLCTDSFIETARLSS